ncbi:DUF3284 domain-containing protein [Enterococcus saccharolyticus]|uniref:DUF3284 domain-containing protein n=1 Tax=Candidatus Enterococcus willemsii TaxID=1857215 RepID=A0ABQ6YZV1_9ENTE|nr:MULTISPECIES: DUF3284 domain-containing protein [Enterococcus]KAF1303475.1 hypothetical protein BAU17_12255 [Enterococcus sp. CU12B]MCD5002661.1 DUF3284 domain-containing protein [Enterococcus saccharolyticus]
MEIVKKMQVPASFFYKKIIDSVLYDIQDTTGRTLSESQLKNFEYVKQFNEKTRATIKIEDIKLNETYAYRTSTTRNEFVATYTIHPIDDTNCEITYSEQMKSHGTIQALNDMVTGLLLGFFKKKQFKRMLQMIESSYS